MRASSLVLGGLLLMANVAACGGPPAVESVYALRAFEREKVTPTLVKQHLDELSGSVALIRRILRETPYQPGAEWTQTLALSSATATEARDALLRANPLGEEPTTLAVYAHHVDTVLARARSPVSEAKAQAAAATAYPSLLDALARADPTLEQLQRDFEKLEELARQVKDARAAVAVANTYKSSLRASQKRRNAENALESYQRQVEAKQRQLSSSTARLVVKDAVAATSVALRLAREAAALASMLMLEIPRLTALPARDYAAHAEAAVQLIKHGPEQVTQIRADLEISLQALSQLLGVLARLDASAVEQAAGFAYREGLVDEVVGFTADLFHVKAEAGGEAYFFQPFTLEGGRDHAGRQNEVGYQVDPIVLASAKLSAGFDLSRLPQAGGLKLGYATDRVYKSGGSIEASSLARELGVTGVFSDAIDAALLYAGWQSSVRLAHFTSGTVDVAQAGNGALVTSAPFRFTLREISFAREFVAYGSPYTKSMIAKISYFDYSIPRIMYEFQDTTPDAESATWVFGRESPVQRVRTELLTTGGISQWEVPLLTPLDLQIGINMSLGAGRQKFYFVDAEGNRQEHEPFTFALSALAQLGLRWRVFHIGRRFRADLEASYQAQYLNSSLGTTFGLDGAVLNGSQSLFHGPHGRFAMTF